MKRWYGIQLELSAVLDMHCIIDIKIHSTENIKLKRELIIQRKRLEKWIIKGMGNQKFQEVLISSEYNNLWTSNEFTFNAINVAEEDVEGKLLSANQLNNINKKRTEAKRALMAKYFHDEIDEIKIGKDGERMK